MQKEFEENSGTVVLALIYHSNSESRTSTLLPENIDYLILSMDQDKSQLKSSVLYHWYVVDRNKEIRWRKKYSCKKIMMRRKNEMNYNFLGNL